MKVRFQDNLRKEAEQFYYENQHHGRMVFSTTGIEEIWRRGEWNPDMNISRIVYPTDLLMLHELEVYHDSVNPLFLISVYPYKDILIFNDHVRYIDQESHYRNSIDRFDMTDRERMAILDARIEYEKRLSIAEDLLPPLDMEENNILWDRTIEDLF